MPDIDRAIKTTGRLIDAWMPHKITYSYLPSASIGITFRGKLVYANAFGYADIENKVKATPKTAYRIASNSKTFTGVAVMQLVEKRKLALDDKVASHLSWFKGKAKDRDAANVTIRQLLSHGAGVFRDGITTHWDDDKFPTLPALKKSVSQHSLVFENLQRFKYSNFGLALVGAVIEKASGMTYDDYVTKNIIEPLGMRRTAPDLTEESKKWLANGYSRQIPGEERTQFTHCKTNAYASATGFLSTVEDLSKYQAALSLTRNVEKLLPREAKKTLFHPQWQDEGGRGSYAHGFEVWNVDGKKVVGHGGGFPGFITRTALSITEDIGVVVLTNANDSPAGMLADGILQTIHRFADPGRDYFNGERKALARFEGTYRNRWADLTIVATGHRLVGFSPVTNSPLSEGTVLRPVTASSFVLESPFGFDSPGERARFQGPANKPARTMFWGSNRFERIS